MIKEPQKAYLLELLSELGDLGNDFVLAGGQAMHFMLNKARPTKDFDFVLDVYSLREKSRKVADLLSKLGYTVDPKARNFQFAKQIPNSNEVMRIEFLGCEENRKSKDKRVKIQDGLHARDCDGADIVLRESFNELLRGNLPSGISVEANIRIIQPQALVMLKLLAMDDRYWNIRGPKEARHDREEAIIHAGDIVSIIHANIGKGDFPVLFWRQFGPQQDLKRRSIDILRKYFENIGSVGIQLYTEYVHTENPAIDRDEAQALVNKAIREVRALITSKEF